MPLPQSALFCKLSMACLIVRCSQATAMTRYRKHTDVHCSIDRKTLRRNDFVSRSVVHASADSNLIQQCFLSTVRVSAAIQSQNSDIPTGRELSILILAQVKTTRVKMAEVSCKCVHSHGHELHAVCSQRACRHTSRPKK